MAVALTTKVQEAVDRFYIQQGPCCAGCDWWHHHNSLVGECHKSAPVLAEQRYGMVRMDWHTFRLSDPDAGHILTNRDHHCGDFKDGFDWPSLPPQYLRRIGWDRQVARSQAQGATTVSPARQGAQPDGCIQSTGSGDASSAPGAAEAASCLSGSEHIEQGSPRSSPCATDSTEPPRRPS